MRLMTPRLRRFAMATALVIVWLALVGGRPAWWIMLLYLLTSITAVECAPKLLSRQRPLRSNVLRVAFVGVGLWSVMSLIADLSGPALEVTPGRFATIRPNHTLVALTEGWQGLRIGLALSGGGYRAAVFHSGVLQALESYGIRVSHLSTVSGGSIIGAYYAVGGEPARFVEAVAKDYFNLRGQLVPVE